MKQTLLAIAIFIVSAYNAGIQGQTSSHPCIAADGEDICYALSLGEKICANNYFPFGTWLKIPNYGLCRVADRMNKRYGKGRIDVAFSADEAQESKQWGIEKLNVNVLN